MSNSQREKKTSEKEYASSFQESRIFEALTTDGLITMRNKNNNNNMAVTVNFKIAEKGRTSSVKAKYYYAGEKLQQLDAFDLSIGSSKNLIAVSKDDSR
jgi:hypothetical protein